jgi:iron complex outermembrane recepter protein
MHTEWDGAMQYALSIGRALIVGATLLTGLAAPAHGRETRTDGAADPPYGSIAGRVIDATTGDAVAVAHVRLLEAGRAQTADASGTFRFRDVPPGAYTLVAERIGYAPATLRLELRARGDTTLTVTLRPSALQLSGVVVTAVGGARAAGDVYQPTAVLAEAALRRALGTTVTATIAGQPGIHEQYNGPAASQPVIRGMGGDRVLVLEDGQRTGDLYSTAPDHAVAIDPLTAERVEIVRGPAGLLYGSNALGGVINVVRDEVPASLPARAAGVVSAQGESAYRGVASGGSLLVPVGRFALRGELSARRTGDTRTPLGTLESTALDGLNLAGGASFIARWGHVGVAARHYRLDHGVPGEFGGEQIPGAHTGGVEIESRRTTARLEAAHRAGLGPFRSVSLSGGFVHYLHDEIEGRGPGGEPWVGTHFDQLSGEARLVARHDHQRNGVRREGAVGFEYRGRDLRAGGAWPGLRSATEHGAAAYIYEEIGRGALRMQLGARYDVQRVEPYRTDPILVGRGASAREVPVEARTFGAVSGSLAALINATPSLTFGVSAARSFRAPSIRELFSDGPHLADYSFDIGNPQLDAEIGHGVDVFARAGSPVLQLEASLFVNAISNFIYYEATGELDPRFERFPVFQARGSDALFRGAEARVQWQAATSLVIDATTSYVAAERRATRDPLPSIPPLTGSAALRYERTGWFASLGWRGAAEQGRVPHAITAPDGTTMLPQRPTDGYALLDAGAGLRFSDGQRFHTVTLNLRNALDAVWRDHLSRTKDIAPQPGRNIQLLYRVSF